MHTILSIPGICCDSCRRLITSISALFPSIRDVDVDLESRSVTLRHTDEFDVRAWISVLEHRSPQFKILTFS